MGRLRHGVPAAFLLSLGSVCAGCGGSSSVAAPPPPPAPDFTLILSSNSISIAQGAASSAVSFSVNPVNGFSGTVQVTLNALPSGVTSNPASPFRERQRPKSVPHFCCQCVSHGSGSRVRWRHVCLAVK